MTDWLSDSETSLDIEAERRGDVAIPKCKCGKNRAYYGPHAGYSTRCEDCNAHGAKLGRESRARLKRKGLAKS